MGEWSKQSKHTDLRLEAIGRTRILGIKDGQCSIPESHKHTALKVPAMMEKVNGPDTIIIINYNKMVLLLWKQRDTKKLRTISDFG